MIPYIDLHCDTLLSAWRAKQPDLERLPQACVVMAIVAIYAFVWNKRNKIPVNETVPLETYVNRVRERSEYLPVWDEAVVEWMNQRAAQR